MKPTTKEAFMKSEVDLHTHSTASDGTLSPSGLVKEALNKGLKAIALTDHDTVSGLPEAFAASEGTSLTIIPGVEISSRLGVKDIHILGYYINNGDDVFLSRLKDLVERRTRRNLKVIDRMNRDGIAVSMDALKAYNPDTVVTRAHFARYLADNGYVRDKKQAFKEYLGVGCPYYIPRDPISPERAVDIIKDNGGLAYLAHPGIYKLEDDRFASLLNSLISRGLDGIEVYYSTHTEEETAGFLRVAREYHLAISGGSDFHGSNKPDIELGSGKNNLELPESLWTEMKSLAKRSE